MDEFRIISYYLSAATVNGAAVNDRIDASYYRATHLELADKVAKFIQVVPLQTRFFVTKLSGFEFTKHFTESVLMRGIVPCVMSENVRNNQLDMTGCIHITRAVHDVLTCSALSPGEVVLSYTGYYRRAAVVPNENNELHLGPNVCKLTPLAIESDPYFLSTFLNSRYGQNSLDREKTISAQPTVNMNRIRCLAIPDVDPAAQRYIGDKVRQAERLRVAAQKREAAFNDLMGMAYPEIDKPFAGLTKHGRAPASLLDGTLNPGEFNPDRMKVREYLKQHGGKLLKDVATVETPVVSTYSPSDLYIGLDSIGSSCGTLTPSTIANEAVVGAMRTLPEGPVISKLRPYLRYRHT